MADMQAYFEGLDFEFPLQQNPIDRRAPLARPCLPLVLWSRAWAQIVQPCTSCSAPSAYL